MENDQAQELYLYIAERLRQYNLTEFHNLASSQAASGNENVSRFLLRYVQQLKRCFELHSPEMVDRIVANLNRDVHCDSGSGIEAILVELSNMQYTNSIGDVDMKQLVNLGPLTAYFETLEETLRNDMGLKRNNGLKP